MAGIECAQALQGNLGAGNDDDATAELGTNRGEDKKLMKVYAECERNGYQLTGKFLGRGSYAQVYEGEPHEDKIKQNLKLTSMHKKNKDLKVAIKIINVKTAPDIYTKKFLPREISNMSRCNGHKNVLKLLDLFATECRIYMVLELAEGGDLLNHINERYSKKKHPPGGAMMTEDEARVIFGAVVTGVRHVHSKGIAHRDLKCENILLSRPESRSGVSSSPPRIVAKLSDFGFAIRHPRGDDVTMLRTHCGSYAYAAPEILRLHVYSGKPADMWSLGVILYAMVHGQLPFHGSTSREVQKSMRDTVYFRDTLTEACKDLLENLLKMRASQRLTAQNVLQHPWLTGKNINKKLENDMLARYKVPTLRTPITSNKSSTSNKTSCSVFAAPSKFDDVNYVTNYIRKVLNGKQQQNGGEKPPSPRLHVGGTPRDSSSSLTSSSRSARHVTARRVTSSSVARSRFASSLPRDRCDDVTVSGRHVSGGGGAGHVVREAPMTSAGGAGQVRSYRSGYGREQMQWDIDAVMKAQLCRSAADTSVGQQVAPQPRASQPRKPAAPRTCFEKSPANHHRRGSPLASWRDRTSSNPAGADRRCRGPRGDKMASWCRPASQPDLKLVQTPVLTRHRDPVTSSARGYVIPRRPMR